MRPSVPALVLTLLATPVATAQERTVVPVLAVQGNAEVRVAPELAVVRLGIVDQAASATAAQQGVNRVADAVLAAVRDTGLEDRQVQTSRLTLTPIYARQEPGNLGTRRITGYRATNTITIRVERLDRVGAVIDAALGAGANQLEGVTFSLENDLAAREDALRIAVAEARSKAEVMASALGVQLGGIIAVREGGASVREPMMETVAMRAMALQSDGPTPVSPGEYRSAPRCRSSTGLVSRRRAEKRAAGRSGATSSRAG